MKKKIIIVFTLLLVLAIIADLCQEKAFKDGVIQRDEIGGDNRELLLFFDIEGLFEEESYMLEVLPAKPTKEEAEILFKNAIAAIEKDFQEIGEYIPLQRTYEEGAVKADWLFHPYGSVDSEGYVNWERLEGANTINAQVELICGEYEKIYSFAFDVTSQVLSEEEVAKQQLENWMEQQMDMEGTTELRLPSQINGKKVRWSQKQEYRTPQILLLELVTLVLLWLLTQKKKTKEQQKRIQTMERDYPEVVNQLSLLLGAGMTTRQAWNKLAMQYQYKRKSKMIEEKEVYEAIVRMNRRFLEGESESAVYQQFSQEIPASSYHKLMRILLGNLEKGSQGICSRLEEEGRSAYEQRIQLAKKLGEEASTKMLLPLMLMMIIVMGIVMLPALIEFQI